MVHVVKIDAPVNCADCTGIQHLCLSDGRRLTRENMYWQVRSGEKVRSGSEAGPLLEPAERGLTRYVRTVPNDTPTDNLLQRPRGC